MPTKIMATNKTEDIDEYDGPLNNKLKDPSMDAADPIYYTISSDNGSKPILRNCVSLENLGGLTIKNDLNGTIGVPPNRNTAIMMNQHKFNNTIMFQSGFPAMYQQYPPPPPTNMQYNDYWNWSRYSAIGGYGGFTNPNPYSHSRSNTNSKQSLGSDDYRKYRDVAL